MEVVVVEIELAGGVLEERREQVRLIVVDEDDGDGALHVAAAGVAEGPARTGGVGDVGVGQQDQRVEPLVGHAGPQSLVALALHAREVRRHREVQTGRSPGAKVAHQPSRPRNACTLALTSFTATSGPTAATTLASDCSE